MRQGIRRRGKTKSHARPLTEDGLAEWKFRLEHLEEPLTAYNKQLLYAAQRRAMIMAARGQIVLEPERR